VPVNAFTSLQHVAVMACVAILSEDVAKLPIRVYRRLPNCGKEEVEDQYLARLLKKPNDWQTRFEPGAFDIDQPEGRAMRIRAKPKPPSKTRAKATATR
jgi:hypothetical protein